MAPHCCADGVFRFLLNSHGLERSAVFVQSGVWTAVLDIKGNACLRVIRCGCRGVGGSVCVGEMYQAFFDSQNDALTAFNAAGYY